MSSERLARARGRLDAMLADPFGRQILRELVPPGHLITVVLDDERTDAAVRRCVRSSGLPTVMAVDRPGVADLVLLVVDHHGDGMVTLSRPGHDDATTASVDASVPLADVMDLAWGTGA